MSAAGWKADGRCKITSQGLASRHLSRQENSRNNPSGKNSPKFDALMSWLLISYRRLSWINWTGRLRWPPQIHPIQFAQFPVLPISANRQFRSQYLQLLGRDPKSLCVDDAFHCLHQGSRGRDRSQNDVVLPFVASLAIYSISARLTWRRIIVPRSRKSPLRNLSSG
jgi:hypothetical protein